MIFELVSMKKIGSFPKYEGTSVVADSSLFKNKILNKSTMAVKIEMYTVDQKKRYLAITLEKQQIYDINHLKGVKV